MKRVGWRWLLLTLVIAVVALGVPSSFASADDRGHQVINLNRGDAIPADLRIPAGWTLIGTAAPEWVEGNAGHFVGGAGDDGAWGNEGVFNGGPGDDYVIVNDGLFIGGPGVDWVSMNFGRCVEVEIGC
jgi:hypothetical protein